MLPRFQNLIIVYSQYYCKRWYIPWFRMVYSAGYGLVNSIRSCFELIHKTWNTIRSYFRNWWVLFHKISAHLILMTSVATGRQTGTLNSILCSNNSTFSLEGCLKLPFWQYYWFIIKYLSRRNIWPWSYVKNIYSRRTW